MVGKKYTRSIMKKQVIKNIITVCLLLTGIFIPSFAQDVSFNAQAPRVVRAGEQFQLVYTLGQNVDDFTPPDFGDFRFLGGPSTGSSTSISMVNGRTTRTSTYTFTYYLQAPGEGGTFTLQPATATYKRKQVQSNQVTIEVVASGNKSSQSFTTGNQGTDQQATESTGNGENIYVRLEVDKKSAYVGEQITAWVKLYTQVNISGIDQQFKGPEFVGFYQQNVELPPLTSLERERVGDDIYHTGVIRKVILIPQKSGEITIEPFDLLVEVQKQTRRQPQSIFDEFFNSPYERTRINLKSKPVKLNIKPLPSNQPSDFSGAVGTFQINGSVNLSEVSTNDAVTFKVNVAGTGNIKLIDKVSANFPPTFDVFDPVKKVQTDAGSQGKSGRVIFEYTAIPRHAGDFKVPPFSLAYFDLSTHTYKTLSTQSFDIKVYKGEGDSTTIVASNLSKEEIELLGSDIRYIETKTNLTTRENFIFGSKWFFGIYIIITLATFIVLFARRRKIQRNANLVRLRNRKAGKVATRRLKKVRKLLKANDKNGFYDELEQALWGYLADKFNIPFSELSKDKVNEEFNRLKISSELTESLYRILDTCQFTRYAPGGASDNLLDIYVTAAQIINKLDQNL